MYDIDPPSPVLHLTGPKSVAPISIAEQLDRYRARRSPAAVEPMLVFKDCQTGELLGPSAPFWPPSRAVYAVPEGSGWREVTKPRVHIAEGIAAHWARLHTARQIKTNRAINRGLLTLTEQIDAL